MTEMTFMVYICKKNWQQRCKLKNQSMSYNLQAEYSAGEELSHTGSLLHPSSSTVKIVSLFCHFLPCFKDFLSAMAAVSLLGVTSSPPAQSRISSSLLNKNTDVNTILKM